MYCSENLASEQLENHAREKGEYVFKEQYITSLGNKPVSLTAMQTHKTVAQWHEKTMACTICLMLTTGSSRVNKVILNI